MAGAAVLHEEADEPAQRVVIGAVDDRARLAPPRDQPRALQLLEVERDVGGGDADRLGHLARGNAVRSGSHQQPYDFKPGFLRQSGETGEGLTSDHISTILEL